MSIGNLNGFTARVIFSGWMGANPMPPARTEALLSLQRNTGCPSAHLTLSSLLSWQHPDFPIHPAFEHLSAVHRCDYLRCYLLHVYGGGYADVKVTEKNWHPFFDQLENSSALGLGYTEVGPHGVARVGGQLEINMKENWQRLIGMCAMIFRPRSELTTLWHGTLHKLLDSKFETLKVNPARHPQDHLGVQFSDGTTSAYPFEWTEVGGNVFHPIAFKFADAIAHADIAPSFANYR